MAIEDGIKHSRKNTKGLELIKQPMMQAAVEEINTQLALADRISRLTIHSSSAQEIAQGTVRELSSMMPVQWASMALVDKAGKTANIRVLIGKASQESSKDFAIANTAIDWVVENKRALLEPDLMTEKQYKMTVYGENIRTQIHMPLFNQGDIFGVLTVGSQQPNAYNESHMRILRYVAIHLATSLKVFLLLEQNLKTEASLTDLGDLLGIITSRAEMSDIFPQFAHRLRKIIPIDHISLNHIESKIVRILAVFPEKSRFIKVNDTYPIYDTAVPWLQEHGKINIEENLDNSYLFPIDKLYLEKGYKGAIRLPLHSHGRLFASIELLSYKPYHLEEEMDFLEQLSQYMATPVESYVFYLQEKQRLDWLNALAHHLKTPLTPIISSSKLMAEELLQSEEGGPQAKLVQNILSGAENLDYNLKVFWELSEIESSEFSLKIMTIDPGPIIVKAAEEAVAVNETEADSHLLNVECFKTLPHIPADAERLSQVLNILLVNCIKSSPRESGADLQVKYTEKEVIIEVADSGKTLSDRERENLLRPFRLSEADKKVFPQLALDLAIVRRLIELHGGRFWISSRSDHGNVFGFSLPCKS